MNDLFLQRLCQETGVPDLPDVLCERLSPSDLSALMLEVFRRQAGNLTPAALLSAYKKNRLVKPSAVHAISFREFELDWLRAGLAAGFEALELSPVGPLGSCSAVATVHQHKVLSALRGTEVVADCTNILALEASVRRQAAGCPTDPLHLCAAHRHLRTPQTHVPGFTAHFGVFCLTSSGRDTGSFAFEKEHVVSHIGLYLRMLRGIFNDAHLTIALKALDAESGHNPVFEAVHETVRNRFAGVSISVVRIPQQQQEYYRALQFGIVLAYKGNEYPVIDGGFTDWTQRLTGNRKERFIASGIGLEFVWKLRTGQFG